MSRPWTKLNNMFGYRQMPSEQVMELMYSVKFPISMHKYILHI